MALPRSPTAAAADALALVAFATLGLLAHERGLTAAGFGRTALPFLAGWFAVALAAGLYRRPSAPRLAATWALGVGAGLLLRGLALGEAPAPAFVAVAFGTVLALTAGWRLVLAGARRGR